MQALGEVHGEVHAEAEGEIQPIIYRETFNDNSNLKNYKITSLNEFYYREESLINAQADQAKQVQEAEDLAEEQTFCHYDEICSRQKLCGDCAADEYEQDQYEEDWENYKIDSMCQDD